MNNLVTFFALLMVGAISGAAVCFMVGAITGGPLVGLGVLLIVVGAHLLSMRVEGW